jgi:protoporphyrinogen IX oxidase
MTTLDALIPHLKALHVGLMAVWMAGLAALPAMLARHDRAVGQSDFARIRRATHYGYIGLVTPAAVLTVVTGTTLIFLREVFTGWMFAKLIGVAALVTLHAWVGHTIVAVAETEGRHEPPGPVLPALILCTLAGCVLLLVLAKPELDELPVPQWLAQPLGRELPFDVPNP